MTKHKKKLQILQQKKLLICGCGLFLILVRNSKTFVQILKLLSNFVKYFCFQLVKHDNFLQGFNYYQYSINITH